MLCILVRWTVGFVHKDTFPLPKELQLSSISFYTTGKWNQRLGEGSFLLTTYFWIRKVTTAWSVFLSDGKTQQVRIPQHLILFRHKEVKEELEVAVGVGQQRLVEDQATWEPETSQALVVQGPTGVEAAEDIPPPQKATLLAQQESQ